MQKIFTIMIKLEKFTQSDFDRLIGWVDSEELMIQFSGSSFTYPITHEQLEKHLATENRIIYKVISTDSGEVIGHAELGYIDTKNKNARICRILIGEKRNRDKGFGRAIIQSLIHIGFCDLDLHRLDLGVFDFNTQAIKCYKDCGFEIEGLLKDTIKMKKGYWSIYNMSLINPNN